MARIIVLCEGDTEELAVRHFLARQWATDGFRHVGLNEVSLRGRLQDVGVKARLFLEDRAVLAVFTLIDLYGMDRVQHSVSDGLPTKVKRVQNWLSEQVRHGRSKDFHPHVAVHETEAWILAEGAALARRLDDVRIAPDRDAESRNFLTPPHELINRLFLSRRLGDRYQKIRDGRPLFAQMRFEPVYQSSTYFREFYDDLRSVVTR